MGQIRKTIQMLTTAGISATAMLLIGCADTTTPVQGNANGIRGNVTDVSPMVTATPAYQPPAYDNSGVIPTAPQPIASAPIASTSLTSTPVAMTTSTPSYDDQVDSYLKSHSSSKNGSAAGKKHTVKKGETLFSIAKVSYGSGKLWKKIVAANPGVTPAKLKVGQVIVVPA
jgi:nucleoid-associated protein YgaU